MGLPKTPSDIEKEVKSIKWLIKSWRKIKAKNPKKIKVAKIILFILLIVFAVTGVYYTYNILTGKWTISTNVLEVSSSLILDGKNMKQGENLSFEWIISKEDDDIKYIRAYINIVPLTGKPRIPTAEHEIDIDGLNEKKSTKIKGVIIAYDGTGDYQVCEKIIDKEESDKTFDQCNNVITVG